MRDTEPVRMEVLLLASTTYFHIWGGSYIILIVTLNEIEEKGQRSNLGFNYDTEWLLTVALLTLVKANITTLPGKCCYGSLCSYIHFCNISFSKHT